MSTPVTLVGNLTADPELKFTQQGKALAKFTIVTSERYKNADGNWEDKNTTFWNVVCWNGLAEHVADSLSKGDQAIVFGRAFQKSWEDEKTGEKRQRPEVEAKSVGAGLDRASAKITRFTKPASGSAPVSNDPWASAANDDPWAAASKQSDDLPPF
jgi:single-strand DNA-binding protein